MKIFVEFLDGFRTNSTFQQQDRNELTNLASSLTSFFDYTGITDLAQTRIASKIEIYFRIFFSFIHRWNIYIKSIACCIK